MKNLKKVLALVLALCMILSTFTALTITTASAATPTFNDIEGTEYAEAVEVLSALGIVAGYEDGSFGGDKVVTRAEMAAFIVREIGLANAAASAAANSSNFTDVGNGSADWAVGSINIATQKNIIVGRGDGTFDPNSTVNYQEAVKMLVCALGRDVVAVRNGGWPSGYLIAAASCGLTDGITGVEATDGCNRGVVAVLLYNALEIKLMEETAYSGSAVQVEVTAKTLLYDYLNVVKYDNAEINATPTKGTNKTAAGYATISGTYYRDNDYYYENGKTVENKKVEIGNTDPDAYFGDSVVIYAKDNGAAKTATMLCIVPDDSAQETFEIAVSDFYSSTPVVFPGDAIPGENGKALTGNDARLYYKTENDTKAQFVKLLDSDMYSSLCTIVVNGTVVNGADWNDLSLLKNGTIKLIDAKSYNAESGVTKGSDGVYEKVVVDTYNSYVVSDVDVEKGIIDTKNDVDIELDENTKIFTIVDTNGEELSLEDIKENDVLSVYADELDPDLVDDAAVLKIVVCSNSVQGTVTEKTSKAVYIDGEKYKIVDSDILKLDDFELDDAGTFYLNSDGKIAYIDTEAASKDYAVIYDIDTDGRSDNYRKLTVYAKTSKGENVELEINKAFDLVTYAVNGDGKYSKTTTKYDIEKADDAIDDAYAILDAELNKKGAYTPFIVSYDTKSGNAAQIDKLYLPGNKAGATSFATRFAIWAENVTAYYNNSESTLGAYIVDGSTVIFDIPSDLAKKDAEDRIKVYGKSGLTNAKNYKNVSYYEIDKNNTAKAVVMRTSGSEIDEKSSIAVVQSVSVAKNSNGDEVYKLYMIQNGKVVSKTTEDSNTLDCLGKTATGHVTSADGYDQYSLEVGYGLYAGAVVMFSEAGDGSIDNLMKIYPIPTKTELDENGNIDGVPYYKAEYFTTWNFSAAQGNSYGEGCECFIAFGKVTDKNKTNKTITVATRVLPTAGGEWIDYTMTANYSSANITTVDFSFEENDEKVAVGSSSDIDKGSLVLVRKYNGLTKDIVVYKDSFNVDKIDVEYDY